jgi:hypothetical protein
MAVVVCDAEVANWNHYVACLLLASLFLPVACARSSSGNVHVQYVCFLRKEIEVVGDVTVSQIRLVNMHSTSLR